MLAKIASDYRKPDGLFTIPARTDRRVRRGPSHRAVLRHRGGDGPEDARHGNPYGRRPQAAGRGEWSAVPARPDTAITAMPAASTNARSRRTASANRSARRRPSPKIPTEAEETRLRLELSARARRGLAIRLMRHEFKGKTVALKLKFDNFRQMTRSKTTFRSRL